MRRRPSPRRWKRILAILGIVIVVLGALGAGAAAWLYRGAKQSNVGELAFADRLAIPELAEPTVDEDGRKVFDLRFMAGETDLVDAGPSETWGLNGTYLGPTLRAERGDRVQVNVTNGVDEATTLHWHGMHLPARMDGGPHQMIDPGGTWSPSWTVDQPAASLWYHPHLHGKTADHVYRGAAGMFVVDDPAADVELPDTYGVDDIPLILQDKRFDDDGSLDGSAPFGSTTGILGDTILVNGTYDPYVEATTKLVRFRVVNASNARVYNLGFTDDRRFWQVGSDSGLLEQPHETRRVQVAPGERAEIVVPVEPGDDAVLRSFGPDLGMGFNERFNGGDDTFDILQIRGAARLDESAPLPGVLATIDRPDTADAADTRRFSLRGTEINGRHMDRGRIDEVVTQGSTEIWEVTNDHGNAHSFHPHLVHFAVLDVDGAPPPPEMSGWKDTIYVPPHTTIRIIARFDGEADPDTPYMYHCHMLAHEDDGMMGQFVLVEPGDEPGDVASMEDHEH
jgi:FtsP/CotA-like multicopper oxidase with cupredoxin domain